MSAPQIAEILRDRYGFDFPADRVQEIARTATSTVYEANNDDGAAVQIEVLDPPAAGDVDALDEAFASVTAPGAWPCSTQSTSGAIASRRGSLSIEPRNRSNGCGIPTRPPCALTSSMVSRAGCPGAGGSSPASSGP